MVDPVLREAIGGVGILTSAASAGTNVVLNVDKDLRGKLQINQPITLINGGSGAGAACQTTTVKAVTSSTVTVALITGTGVVFDTGSIIGLNPMPVYVSNWDPISASNQYTVYFIFTASHTRSGPLGQTAIADWLGSTFENWVDDNPIDLYYLGSLYNLHLLFPLQYWESDTVRGRERWMMIASNAGSSWSWGDRVLVGAAVDPDDGWGTCGGIFDEPYNDGNWVYVVGPGVPDSTLW